MPKITVRRMGFGFSDDIDPVCVPSEPVEINGLFLDWLGRHS